jgi:hypothetical protein
VSWKSHIFSRGDVESVISTSRGLFVSRHRRTANHRTHRFLDLARPRRHAGSADPRIPYSGDLAADGPGVLIGVGQAGIIHWIPKS